MNSRVISDIAVLFLVIYTPYWVYLPFIFACIIVFPLFWEAVLFGLIIDYFYGPHTASGTLFAYPFAVASALITLAFVFIRERLRINA